MARILSLLTDIKNMSNDGSSLSLYDNLATTENAIKVQTNDTNEITETYISVHDAVKNIEAAGLTTAELSGTTQKVDCGSKNVGGFLAGY